MKQVLSILCILLAIEMLVLVASANGAILLHEKAVCGPDPRTETKEYRVDLTNPNAKIGIILEGRAKSGRGTFKVTGPTGENLLGESPGKATIQLSKIYGPFSRIGIPGALTADI